MLAAITKNILQGQSFVQNMKYGFATKMQAGSTQKTKDSAGRRLGVKKFGSEEVLPNDILVRQRGFRWKPGNNTVAGVDHTIHSKIEGVVYFERLKQRLNKVYKVHVIPRENPNRTQLPPPPYCYHPELFPELAANNPPPTNYKNKLQKPKKERPEKKTFFTLAQQVYGQIQIPESLLQKHSEQVKLQE